MLGAFPFFASAALTVLSGPELLRQMTIGAMGPAVMSLWIAAPASIIAACRIRTWPYVLLAVVVAPFTLFATVHSWELIVVASHLR